MESDDVKDRELVVDRESDGAECSGSCPGQVRAALNETRKNGIVMMQERMYLERQSRRPPPGIDRWVVALQKQAAVVLANLTCEHMNRDGFQGVTYVLQGRPNGLVKIGRAGTGAWSSVSDRLAEIQSMSPVELDVVALIRDPKLERQFHIRFYRQRVHCEWFAPEVADWFRSQGAPGCVLCGKVRTA